MDRRNVLLPHPLGPIMAMTRLRGMPRDTRLDRFMGGVKYADAARFDEDVGGTGRVWRTGRGNRIRRGYIHPWGRGDAARLKCNSTHTSFGLHGFQQCICHPWRFKHFKKH